MAAEREKIDHAEFIRALQRFDSASDSSQSFILEQIFKKYPQWLDRQFQSSTHAPTSSSSSAPSSSSLLTPLEYAITENEPELFQYLLKQGANPSIKSEIRPSLVCEALQRFLRASSQPEFLLELLKYGVDPLEEREEYDLTSLSSTPGSVTARKKTSIFSALNGKFVSPSEPFIVGNTTPEIRAFALMSAIKQGKQTETQQLLEKGFSETQTDHLGKTALQCAAESKNPLIQRVFLNYAFDRYTSDVPQGKTLKNFLVHGGNPFQKVIPAGANEPPKSVVDQLASDSNSGWSPAFQSQVRALALIWAIKNRDTAKVQALCKEEDLAFDEIDQEGKSALQHAAECDIGAIRHAVVERYKQESDKGEQSALADSKKILHAILLIDAILRKCHSQESAITVEAQVEIERICAEPNTIALGQTDPFGATALHLAMASGDPDIESLVLAAYQSGLTTNPPADFNKIGPTREHKNTPLHLAAKNGKKEYFRALLKMGISSTYKNKEGYYALEKFPVNNTLTPLDKQEFAYYMLEAAVKDTNLSEPERIELANKAVELGANCLQRLGAPLATSPRQKLSAPVGKTLLLEAIEKNNVPMIHFLIDQAPELIHAKHSPPDNEPILKQVLKHFKPPQRLDIVEALLQAGADTSVFYSEQILERLQNELNFSDEEKQELELLISGYELHRRIRSESESGEVDEFLRSLLQNTVSPEWRKKLLNFKDSSSSTPLGIVSDINSPYCNFEMENILTEVATDFGLSADEPLEKKYKPLSAEGKKKLYDANTDAIRFTLGLPSSPADLLEFKDRFDLRDLFKKDGEFFEQISQYSDNKHSFSVDKLSPFMAALTCASCLFSEPAVTLSMSVPMQGSRQRMLVVSKDHCNVPGNVTDPKDIATAVFAIAATFKAGIIANNDKVSPKHYEIYDLQGEPVIVPYVHISGDMTLGQLKEYITQYYEQGVIPSVDEKTYSLIANREKNKKSADVKQEIEQHKEAAVARFHTRYTSCVEGSINKINAIQNMKQNLGFSTRSQHQSP